MVLGAHTSARGNGRMIERDQSPRYVSTQDTEPHTPNQAPDLAEHVDDFTEGAHSKLRRRLLLAIGTTAAFVAVGGAAFFGSKALANHSPEPGKAGSRPTATASPFEHQSASPTETQSTSSEFDPSTFNFIDTAGVVHQGEAAYTKSLEVTVADYPTAEAAYRQIISVIHGCEMTGIDPAETNKYGKANPDLLRLYDNACTSAVANDSSLLPGEISGMHARYANAYGTSGAYDSTVSVDRISILTADNVTQVWARDTVHEKGKTDPGLDTTITQDRIALLTQEDNGSGTHIWRMTSYENGVGEMPFGEPTPSN
jgi:hypothetical protein